jgi:hypothetical protein
MSISGSTLVAWLPIKPGYLKLFLFVETLGSGIFYSANNHCHEGSSFLARCRKSPRFVMDIAMLRSGDEVAMREII